MEIRLTIAIPTYNRAALLQETLDSILPQDRCGLEIVVCDNASPDSTQDLIAKYRGKFRCLTYFRWPENAGFDRNILKVVEVASGQYCWLLGDDDHLEPGALDAIFPILEKGFSLIYLNAMTYDNEMGRSSGETLSRFACDTPDEALLSLASWITFVSSICVRRDEFMRYLEDGESHVGTGFAHCYPVLRLIHEGKTHIVAQPLVRFRAGNTGGYNIFSTFIGEFNRVMSFCARIGFPERVISSVRTRNVYLVIVPALLQIKLGKLNLAADRVLHYLSGSGLGIKERLLLTVFAWTPGCLIKFMQKLKKTMMGR